MRLNLTQVGALVSVGLVLAHVAAAAGSSEAKPRDTSSTKSKAPKDAHARLGATKGKQARQRPSAGSAPREPAIKLDSPSRLTAAATKRAKLQSRVSRSASPIEQMGDSPLGPDAWSQHGLVPTFVDQEQGDEMVALASGESSESSETSQPAPQMKAGRFNSSHLSDSYMKRYQADRLQREQIEDERFLARELHQEQNNKQRAADDYYADDDDEDADNEQQEPSAQLAKIDQKHRIQQTQAESAAGVGVMAAGRAEQKIADFRPIDASPSVKQLVGKNATATEVVASLQSSANGWLPTVALKQPQQAPDQQQQQQLLQGPTIAMVRGEKVAGFFGARGDSFGSNSLTKTDMAIEYLRNILKTKQNRLQSVGANSSLAGQLSSPDQEASKLDKGLKTFYPLPVQLREFAQPANRTMPASERDMQEMANRFSINDVKQQQGGANQAQAGAASTAAPLTPTTVTYGEGTDPKQTTIEVTKPAPLTPKTSPIASDAALELAQMGSAIEAPLRADLLSRDEISHGFHIIDQQQLAAKSPVADVGQKPASESMSALASERLPAAGAVGQLDGKFHFQSQQNFGPSHSSVYFNLQKPATESRPQIEFKDELQQQVASVAPDFTKSISQVPGTQRNFDFDQANLDNELKLADQHIEQIPDLRKPVQRLTSFESSQLSTSPSKPSEASQAQAPGEQVVDPYLKIDEAFGLERAPPSPPPPPPPPPQAQVKVMPVKQASRQMISSKLYRHEQPSHFPEAHQPSPVASSYPGPHQHADLQQPKHSYQRQVSADHGHAANQAYKSHHQSHPAHQTGQFYQAQQLAQSQQDLQQDQNAQQQQPPPPPESRPSQPPPSYRHEQHPAYENEYRRPSVRAPRIVSYNYFESAGGEHNQPTNFQLGDSLLSSTGDIEHTLSSSELAAIQSQLMSSEHPVVPIAERHHYQQPPHNYHHQQDNERRNQHQHELRDGLRSSPPSDLLHKLTMDPMKELASEEQPSVSQTRQQAERQPAAGAPKRKSLIVYLNHPRGDEMSRSAAASGATLAQLISEQTSGDPFVSAREFDSLGLSREPTRLDVASLQGAAAAGEALPKEALGGASKTDKDGLSVVVIGDAYKYEKIVLLISAKSGGLKFVPLVKDMKKRRKK